MSLATLHAPAPVRVHSAANAHSSRVTVPLGSRSSEAARGSSPRLVQRRGPTPARVARNSGLTPQATLSLEGLFDALVRVAGQSRPVGR